jgi:hypothetical protein
LMAETTFRCSPELASQFLSRAQTP